MATKEPLRRQADRGGTKAIFLSHGSQDAKLAQSLCQILESRGLQCWIAPRDVALGASYASAILDGVLNCRCLVLLASESALGSVQVLSEVEQAHKRAKPIYTVLIPPAKVKGEMDFYLSRLHWLESGGGNADEIAKRLAAVLEGDCPWIEVAAAPTLRRTMRFRPEVFGRLLAASMFSLLLVAGAAGFALNSVLKHDFRHWGYVVLAAEMADSATPEIVGHANVSVMADGVRFADVQLKLTLRHENGQTQERRLSTWPIPEQVESMERISLSLGPDARGVTTCLIVPNLAGTERFRVTQQFVITKKGAEVRASETAGKRVRDEDGSPCGS
jgi:hypothetical protein